MTQDIFFVQLRFFDFENMENIQALLHTFHPLGFLEEEDSWSCYFQKEDWIAKIESTLEKTLRESFPSLSYKVEEFKQENWNKAWEDSITPIRVSDRFIITPSWHPIEQEGDSIVLTIDPKMSFGTGYHQTTRLMLRLIEHTIIGGERVLDVGTGTGILAIAAIKLGAKKADGIDIDEWSYENAVENLQRNGLYDEVTIYHGGIEKTSGTYDAIFSNITKNDNIVLLSDFSKLLEPSGTLLLSGFYLSDIPEIQEAAMKFGYDEIDQVVEDDWVALRYQKR